MGIIDQDRLWRQVDAAIDELGKSLSECPDELWEGPTFTVALPVKSELTG